MILNSLIKNLSKKCLDLSFSIAPLSLASAIEWRVQLAQGKGIGFDSIIHEVRSLIYLAKLYDVKEICLFDVGANHGQYGREVKSKYPLIEVYSFEPSYKAFEELKRCTQNFDNWVPYNLGFGTVEGMFDLFSTELGSASATLLPNQYSTSKESGMRSEHVRIMSLDEFLTQHNHLKPNVLKLDVEGFEMQCLQGAKGSINMFQLVQFEFGESSMNSRTYFRDLWDFFKKRQFDIYRVTKRDPLLLTDYSVTYETLAVTNYIAVKRK